MHWFRVDSSRMLQPQLRGEPWALLVGCMLLNQTTRKQVDRVINELLSRWPTPQQLMLADVEELRILLRPLGFAKKRSATLQKFSAQWFEMLVYGMNVRQLSPMTVGRLHGCGDYAVDSYRIFVLDVPLRPEHVKDKELKAYLMGL